RGGMRSGAMAWALDLYGFEVYLIQGGYKTFRHWAHRLFEINYNLMVLGGMTGSGKTRILHQLQSMGQQIIDLEDLAQHQGSAYGTMNKMTQPTQEQFENNLAYQLNSLNNQQPIWVEDESLTIGKRSIPNALWHQMRAAPVLNINVDTEKRIESLTREYGTLDKDFLIAGTERIHKRLGPEQTKHAIQAIQEGRMADFIKLVLVYYDKTYRTGLSKRRQDKIFSLDLAGADDYANALSVLNFTHTIIHQETL
ncbi:MAG: tRNA 2-selenouridine(34) synthase MnmH, partial [Mucilaginibacter sp.]